MFWDMGYFGRSIHVGLGELAIAEWGHQKCGDECADDGGWGKKNEERQGQWNGVGTTGMMISLGDARSIRPEVLHAGTCCLAANHFPS
jgi:hypothetical protein